MDSIDAARRIVEHYTSNPPNIRQRTVFVQFSNHKELKTDSGPAQQVREIKFDTFLIKFENFKGPYNTFISRRNYGGWSDGLARDGHEWYLCTVPGTGQKIYRPRYVPAGKFLVPPWSCPDKITISITDGP